ncbi:MAG: hypothetical protein PSN37_04915, partial [Alphaproteobacteria bacterium]|nr:hypothetical protein [Alphaproteobacteria bacterium]
RLLQIRYTQPFGSGLSLSLALEDSEPYLGENGGIGAIFGTHLNLRRFVKVSGLPFPALVFSLQLKKPSISAQISGVLLSRNVKWMNSPVETVREKAFRGWGLLAGVARSVPGFGEDRVGAIAFYTSGLDPEFTNSVTPLGKSYLFIWKDALSGKNIVSLDTFGLMAWVKHVWSDKFSTTLGAAYNNVSNNTDFYEFRNEVFTSSLFPKYASALFLHNSFEVFKNLKFAFDIVYEKRKFVSVGRRDFQSGFGAAFQLTYSF